MPASTCVNDPTSKGTTSEVLFTQGGGIYNSEQFPALGLVTLCPDEFSDTE